MNKQPAPEQEANHVSAEQQVKPQKPMSIDEYIKALRKEHEVSKLRAGIAENLFKENLAMFQLQQLKAGNIGQPPPQPKQEII